MTGTRFGVILAVALPTLAAADVIIDQRPDGRDDLLSFWHNPGGFQVGDDYRPTRPTRITSVTFWLAAKSPDFPFDWSFAVHRSTNDHPTRGFGPEYDWFHFQTGPSSLTDLGEWKPRPGTHLFEVTFDNVNLLLDPADSVQGTFWFSPGGWSNHTSNMRSWWITSGEGVVDGNEGWGKSYPIYEYPGWRPVSRGSLPPSDYAMRIEGYEVPAPSALALVMLAAFARRSRRR